MLVGRLSVRPMVAHKCQPSSKDQAHHTDTTLLFSWWHHTTCWNCGVVELDIVYGGSNSSQGGAQRGRFFSPGEVATIALWKSQRGQWTRRMGWPGRLAASQFGSVHVLRTGLNFPASSTIAYRCVHNSAPFTSMRLQSFLTSQKPVNSVTLSDLVVYSSQ